MDALPRLWWRLFLPVVPPVVDQARDRTGCRGRGDGARWCGVTVGDCCSLASRRVTTGHGWRRSGFELVELSKTALPVHTHATDRAVQAKGRLVVQLDEHETLGHSVVGDTETGPSAASMQVGAIAGLGRNTS